jgi:hypothetical protein
VQEVPVFIGFAPVRQLAQMNWRKSCCSSAPVAPVVIPANWSNALTGANPVQKIRGGRPEGRLCLRLTRYFQKLSLPRGGELFCILLWYDECRRWRGVPEGTVPDSEYCFPGGRQGWIEFKVVRGWQVTLQQAQISWIARRIRLGGVVWIAARKHRALYFAARSTCASAA